jgi:hypothetical protein
MINVQRAKESREYYASHRNAKGKSLKNNESVIKNGESELKKEVQSHHPAMPPQRRIRPLDTMPAA